MKRILATLTTLFFFTISTEAQLLKKVLGNQDSGLQKKASQLLGGNKSGSGLSQQDIASGLKAALNQGIEKGTSLLSATDGFFGNAAVKILLPPEATQVETTLRRIGMGKQVDEAILTMNRAAESAAKEALPIFKDAITGISFADAMQILRGGDTAATGYLRGNTQQSLSNAFRPVIEKALENTGATKHWNTIFSNYNRVSLKKVNPDLTGYVTERALQGLFLQVAEEEKKIRKDPLARGSDILKKVFG